MGYQTLDDDFLEMLHAEFRSACQKNRPLNSLHEAYAVLAEEVDELWDEVRKKRSKRDRLNMLKELVQIASCAWRAANDLGLLERPSHTYDAATLAPGSQAPRHTGEG